MIMKKKKELENHNHPTLRTLIIKNMMTQEQIKNQTAMNQLLRKMPGGDQIYITSYGSIMMPDSNMQMS